MNARRKWVAGLLIGVAILIGAWTLHTLTLGKLKAYPDPTRFLPTPPEPATTAASEACRRAYEKFYRGQTIDIRVIFGYKDVRPARFVGDRYEAMIFSRYLLAPCLKGWNACGFVREISDPEIFRKSIEGPDGKPREIVLRVTHSSAGPDDRENRNDAFQKWRTAHASEIFFEGIEKADVIFYNGHSRDGGGPDFAPPHLTSNAHVDYSWYTSHRPGFEKLRDSLVSERARIQLLGLFSCASRAHFTNEIWQAKPEMATITSARLIYYSDALQAQLGALSALLGRECESGFGHALRAHPEAGNSKLNGFFRAN